MVPVVTVVAVVMILLLNLLDDSRQDDDRATNGSLPEEAVREDVYREHGVRVPAQRRKQRRKDVVGDVVLAMIMVVLRPRHGALEVNLFSVLVRRKSGLVVDVVAVEGDVGDDVVREDLRNRMSEGRIAKDERDGRI